MTCGCAPCTALSGASRAALLLGLYLTPTLHGIDIQSQQYQGREHFVIRTEAATWYYDRAGGGFSRLVDRDGRDWIAFRPEPLSEFPTSAAAGYRGLPNAVFLGPDKGAGHPGFDRCESRQVDERTIHTESKSGSWSWQWSFFESQAVFRILEADPQRPWWFLYEGPIAGTFSPASKFWGTDRHGLRFTAPGKDGKFFGSWQWLYVGDRSVPRLLYVAALGDQPHDATNTLWYLGSVDDGRADAPDGMVVVGFGRGPGTRPLLRGADDRRFAVGLTELEPGAPLHHDQLQDAVTSALAREPSGEKPDMRIWYGAEQSFGVPGIAQRWINVLGNVTASGQLDRLSYRIDGQPPHELSVGSDLHRLAAAGDFNIELPADQLSPGTYSLRIAASWQDGTRQQREVTLRVAERQAWPLPYYVDFTRVGRLSDAVQVVDGLWRLDTDGVRTVKPWYDRVLAVGDDSWQDYEATVKLTIHGFVPPQPGPPTYGVSHCGLALRWRGHTADGRQPSRHWYPMGAQGELLLRDPASDCRWRVLPGVDRQSQPSVAQRTRSVPLQTPLWLKAQVVTLPDGDSRYRFKHWPVGTPEPSAWFVENVEPGETDFPSGAFLVVPHNSDVTVHELRVEPVSAGWRPEPAARPGPGALHRSAPVGGLHGARGEPFEIDCLPVGSRLVSVQVCLGPLPSSLVRGIRLQIRHAASEPPESVTIGRWQGTPQPRFTVPPGAELVGIRGASGWYLDSLQFLFSDGSSSPRYGGSGGDTEFDVRLRADSADKFRGRFRGFFGTRDEALETLGLLFDPAD